METHKVTVHCKKMTFHCGECDMYFFTKWRLNKHKSLHRGETKRNCHYFNNGGNCPFSAHGCKFLHKESEMCKYGQNCERTMCKYIGMKIKIQEYKKKKIVKF